MIVVRVIPAREQSEQKRCFCVFYGGYSYEDKLLGPHHYLMVSYVKIVSALLGQHHLMKKLKLFLGFFSKHESYRNHLKEKQTFAVSDFKTHDFDNKLFEARIR